MKLHLKPFGNASARLFGAGAAASRGTRRTCSFAAEFVVAFAVVFFVKKKRETTEVLWRLGHRSAIATFCNFCYRIASGDLAGKTTYKFDQIRKIEQQPEIQEAG